MVLPADPRDPEVLDRIAAHLERGGLLAYPTETVYGLGALADERGVEALRALKGREGDRPFLVLLPNGLEGSLRWDPASRALADAFWPGPLTLVLSEEDAVYPSGVRNREGGVAVRRSPHPFVEALLTRCGRPLLSTSANRPGGPPAMSLDEVSRVVEGRTGRHRLWIADGGPLVASPPSTIVDCTSVPPRLLRSGAISAEELAGVAPALVVPDSDE